MLETPRLRLRPWRVGDAALQRELWLERDPRVPAHRRVDSDGRPTIAELEARIRDDTAPGLLAIELCETDEVVGYAGRTANPHGPRSELAYELLRRYWGNGYATEAASAIVGQARADGEPALWASVRDWNAASFRVLEKLGFARTGSVEPDAAHGDSVELRLDL